MPQFLALSIVAPHGTNIASGRKTLEVRSWRPEQLPILGLLLVENERFLTIENGSDPSGKVVAFVDVYDVHPWEDSELDAACGSKWEPGFWAWELCNVRPVCYPARVAAERKLYRLILEDEFIDDSPG